MSSVRVVGAVCACGGLVEVVVKGGGWRRGSDKVEECGLVGSAGRLAEKNAGQLGVQAG